jgi:hypothetical protein
VTHYADSNFYELLEVEPGSPPSEIDAAYKKQMELLSGAALATYGLFVGNDLVAARQRVEDAYRVLRDPVRRRAYDASGYQHAPEAVPETAAAEISAEAPAPAEAFAEPHAEAPTEAPAEAPAEFHAEALPEARAPVEAPAAAEAPPAQAEAPAPRAAEAGASAPAPAPAPPVAPSGAVGFDGPGFRAQREERGITLSEISARTRIAEYYLGYIEDERFDQLPPIIYLRSYLRQYAAAIGLDPENAINDYLARYNEKKGRKPPERT